MSHRRAGRLALAASMGAALAVPLPPIAHAQLALTDDGRAFVYRLLPGDTPDAAAARLGIAPDAVAAFLRAHGVADATRVRPGFAFRAPNPLAPELDALAAETDRLRESEAAARARRAELERELEAARAAAAAGAAQRARLETLEDWWSLAAAALLGMGIALVIAVAVTVAAVGLRRQALGYADALARELEEKRAAHLAERQRLGRELIAFESRVRELETQIQVAARAS